MKHNPIQIILNSGDYLNVPEVNAGGSNKDFFANRDTLFRLHGTPKWESIGKAMSSGCIRLLNQDIIDLFERVPNGTPVRVI